MNEKLNNEIRKASNRVHHPREATQKEAIEYIKSNIKKRKNEIAI